MQRHHFALVLRCLVLAACLMPSHPVAAESRFAGLRLPDHTTLVAAALAHGVQIYESQPSRAGEYHWELKGPQADLTTVSGEGFGRHDLGPTWTANDGSQVVGTVAEKVDSPDQNAIPWLLLTVRSKGGAGVLSEVDYVLRVETVGGGPPADTPSHVGETRQVPYHALYLFLKKTAAV
jgi:Protein of unknown function (DUF3455)